MCRFLGIMGQRWVLFEWDADPVKRQDRRRRLKIRDITCQEGGWGGLNKCT